MMLGPCLSCSRRRCASDETGGSGMSFSFRGHRNSAPCGGHGACGNSLSLSCYGGVILTGFCLVVFYRDLTCTDMFGFAQTHRLSTVPGSAEEKLSTLVMVKCVDLSEDFFCRLPYQGLGIYCSFVISESPCTINL